MSIKNKFLLLFLLGAVLPLFLVSSITYSRYRASLETVRLADLRHLASYKADKIESYFTGLTNALRISQSLLNIKKNLPVLARDAGDKEARKELDGQLPKEQEVLGLSNILLADTAGRVLYGSDQAHLRKDRARPTPGPEREAFARGKAGEYISDVFLEDGRPKLFMAAPVKALGGGPGGVIAFEVDMSAIYALVGDVSGLGRTGETLVGKLAGGKVLLLNPLRHAAPLSMQVELGKEQGGPIQLAAQGREGAGRMTDYRGSDVVAAWRYIPSVGWGLVAKLDADEAYAEAGNLRNLTALFLGLVLLLGGIASYYGYRSVLEPIARLSKGAEMVGRGDLDYRVGTDARDEIGQLSRAFDRMTSDLRGTTASRDELNREIEVRRRTEEALRESEKRVRLKMESILSPEGDVGALELSDIVDAAAIQKLMDEFYTLSGIPMGLIDLKGKVLVGVGWQDICTKFHRVNPETCAFCVASDTQLTTGIRPGEFKIYKCKNGMWDAATPVMTGDRHTANIFIGQFFFDDEKPDLEFFRAQAARYGFEEKAYLEALARVPRLSRARLNNAMTFFMQFAQLVSRLSFSNIKLAKSLAERDALTRSLRKSENHLNRAQEIAGLGSWELDIPANRLTWSDEVYRIFGLQPQEFAATYEAFLAAVHPEDRAAVDAAYSGSLRDGKDSYEIEHRVIRRSTGEVRVVHEKCEHIRDAEGHVVRSVGMVHDITARKRTEEALARAGRREALLAGSSSALLEAEDPQALVQKICERTMRFLDCQVFFNYLAVPERKRLHLNAWHGIPEPEARRIEWLDYGVAVCGCVARDGERVIANDIPETRDPRTDLVRGYGVRAYCCHPLKSGAEVLGTISFGTTARGRFTDEEIAVMKATADMVALAMQRKRTEEQLRRTNEYLDNIFNYSNAPFICWDPEFRITRFNRAFERLTAYTQEEVLGRDLSMLFPDDSREESLAKIKLTLAGEHWDVVEIPVRRKTGGERLALWNSANVYAQDGKTLLATIAQGQDITRRKQAEDALKRSNESLEQFAYVASHDLQEPLRMMASYSELLERRYKGRLDQDADDFIGFIVDGAKRLQGLINDLLAYSRIGRSEKPAAPVDCNAVLARVRSGMALAIQESGAEVTSGELPVLTGSESNFLQLFQNLIGNAIKFRGADAPRVHVSAERKGGEWEFSVKDNGIGIEPQYYDRIFLIFQRLHGRAEHPGSGIGLAICKKIVEAAHGRIWVESEPGKGSTFRFTLPAKGE